ncbi:hypothetical protein SALBM311S_05927 [Streptomyces alboniger]
MLKQGKSIIRITPERWVLSPPVVSRPGWSPGDEGRNHCWVIAPES